MFSKVILIIDYILTAIFGIEAILKIIANGFLGTGFRSYMRDGTNILDFILVVITVSYVLSQLSFFIRSFHTSCRVTSIQSRH